MVNIQIRGNLIDIEMISISKYNFDNFSTGEFSNDQIRIFIIHPIVKQFIKALYQ